MQILFELVMQHSLEIHRYLWVSGDCEVCLLLSCGSSLVLPKSNTFSQFLNTCFVWFGKPNLNFSPGLKAPIAGVGEMAIQRLQGGTEFWLNKGGQGQWGTKASILYLAAAEVDLKLSCESNLSFLSSSYKFVMIVSSVITEVLV